MTVHGPMPAIAVSISTTCSSASVGKADASLRCDVNHAARLPMLCAFVAERPAFLNVDEGNARIFAGVSGPSALSLRRAKIDAAALPETLW